MTTYAEACANPGLAMARKFEAVPAFGNPVGVWHRWFAWYPISTYDRGMRWLCTVERRRYVTHSYLPVQVSGTLFWHYRTEEEGRYQRARD